MSLTPSRLAQFRRDARRLAKQSKIPLRVAQDRIAAQNGYADWRTMQRFAVEKRGVNVSLDISKMPADRRAFAALFLRGYRPIELSMIASMLGHCMIPSTEVNGFCNGANVDVPHDPRELGLPMQISYRVDKHTSVQDLISAAMGHRSASMTHFYLTGREDAGAKSDGAQTG